MKISPKYTSTDYINLQLKETSSKSDWEQAVKIFDDRYTNRFINPIYELAKSKNIVVWEYSGFAIMALNCLLIETLNQFYYGVNDTDELIKDKSVSHINKIEDAFVDFLTKSKFFNHCFKQKEACLFYLHIRNGLLHQAEVKKGSLIHIKCAQKEMVKIENSGNPNEGISLRRDLFTDSLIKEYGNYKTRLLTEPADCKLREAFIKKMGHICDDTV